MRHAQSWLVEPTQPAHREQVADFLIKNWGGLRMVTRGKMLEDLSTHLGFMVRDGETIVGLLTYYIENGEAEVSSLQTTVQQQGIGGLLLDAYIQAAKGAGCKRAFLITTNDNMNALRFYQKRGFALKALYPNALEESRRLKPEIPLVGFDDIPLRDEIELEMLL